MRRCWGTDGGEECADQVVLEHGGTLLFSKRSPFNAVIRCSIERCLGLVLWRHCPCASHHLSTHDVYGVSDRIGRKDGLKTGAEKRIDEARNFERVYLEKKKVAWISDGQKRPE